MSKVAIRLENVSFSYKSIQVLEKVSLSIKEGEHIGIVGDSGCGKSTLLKILAGLYSPDEGTVMIAGECEPEKIRKQVAMVLQQNGLFPLSIRDNITCGHEMSEETIFAACNGANLTSWIKTLPMGLDTNVGERGGQVSGGQAQRIQIARALCKNAPIILLDEPTSALDYETGKAVMGALDTLMKGKTVIHVTHRPETLDDTYVIYRIKEGGLVRESFTE